MNTAPLGVDTSQQTFLTLPHAPKAELSLSPVAFFGGPVVHDDCRAAHLRETDCVAGHVRLELVVAKYPFESSHRFPRIQPNSGPRDDFAVELRRWPDAARV